ncbi:hypothetical protein [Nostoc sp.]|uniref:hypothetical protein n=1 Tax=Nostoc sp. TaxID=1180 RepID=UPI002FF62714
MLCRSLLAFPEGSVTHPEFLMVRYEDSDSTLMANSIYRVATTAIALWYCK